MKYILSGVISFVAAITLVWLIGKAIDGEVGNAEAKSN